MTEKQTKRILSAKEIESIHKMSTARLIRKLSDIGLTDEQLDLMERDELLHTWVSAVAEGRDKPVPKLMGDQPRAVIMDPEIAQKQLEFERYKLDQEMQFRQQQLQQQQQLETTRLQMQLQQQQQFEAEKLLWQKEQELLRQQQIKEDKRFPNSPAR